MVVSDTMDQELSDTQGSPQVGDSLEEFIKFCR